MDPDFTKFKTVRKVVWEEGFPEETRKILESDPDTWKIVQRYLDGHGNEDLDVMLVELIRVLATKVRDLATREETRNILRKRRK